MSSTSCCIATAILPLPFFVAKLLMACLGARACLEFERHDYNCCLSFVPCAYTAFQCAFCLFWLLFICRSEVHQKMPLPIATLMKSTEPWADEHFLLDMEAAMEEAGFSHIEYVAVNKRHRVLLGVAT